MIKDTEYKYNIRTRVQAQFDCLDTVIQGKPCPCDCSECVLTYSKGTLGEQRADLQVILCLLDNCEIL